MSPLEYFGEAIDAWPAYATLAIFFLALHGWLIRRWAVGLFDPLLVLLVSNAFGWAVVWFMAWRGDILMTHAIVFSLTQLAFYGGFTTGTHRPRAPSPVRIDIDRTALPVQVLVMAGAWHVVSTLLIWALAGIPLFRDSRLGAFQDSGGLGILERISDASSLIAVFAAVYLLIHRRAARRNLWLLAFAAWYVFAIAMSGSKSALLGLMQASLSTAYVYTSLRWQRGRFWGGRVGGWMWLVSAFFALAVLAVQQAGDWGTAAVAFAYRVVSFGDIYVFAYPDSTIDALQGSNPLIGLFGGFLSTFRLFPQDALYPNLGFQFTREVFPDLDLIVGPNPQHPVFGYHYFGWLAPVFSWVLGWVTAAAKQAFYRGANRTFLGGLFRFLLYFTVIGISVDFEYTLSKVASLIIGAVLILGPVLLRWPHALIVAHPRARA